MKTRIVLPALLASFLCLSAATALAAGSPEEAYLEARNAFIQKFDGVADADDRPALAQLERRLRAIIGPVGVEGFPNQGKINLETLRTDLEGSFGNVDGLRFNNERESLFVTTRGLLKLYFAGEPKPTKDLPEPDLAVLSADGKFNSSVFDSGSTVTSYADLPVKSTDGKSFAEAFLGITAQDDGPFIPNTIFVLASKGNRIFLVRAATTTKLPAIPKCKGLAADAHNECYGTEVKNQPFFASLKQQAQSIVDRLQKDPVKPIAAPK
jgi:hypothetical protein